MTSKQAEILVVTPHPDDAEYGISGTVARWTAEGTAVAYVVCTNGDKGTSDFNMDPKELVKIREREQLAAAKVLGVSEVVFLRRPDQGLEDTPDFRKDIVRAIRTFKPRIVVGPDPYRKYIWHRDHRITGRVTLDAVFPYARDHLAYPDLMAEGLTPHIVKEVWCWASENPNYKSDITNTYSKKIEALLCHVSQVGSSLAPEREKWLRQRCEDAAEGEDFDLAESIYRVEIMR